MVTDKVKKDNLTDLVTDLQKPTGAGEAKKPQGQKVGPTTQAQTDRLLSGMKDYEVVAPDGTVVTLSHLCHDLLQKVTKSVGNVQLESELTEIKVHQDEKGEYYQLVFKQTTPKLKRVK